MDSENGNKNNSQQNNKPDMIELNPEKLNIAEHEDLSKTKTHIPTSEKGRTENRSIASPNAGAAKADTIRVGEPLGSRPVPAQEKPQAVTQAATAKKSDSKQDGNEPLVELDPDADYFLPDEEAHIKRYVMPNLPVRKRHRPAQPVQRVDDSRKIGYQGGQQQRDVFSSQPTKPNSLQMNSAKANEAQTSAAKANEAQVNAAKASGFQIGETLPGASKANEAQVNATKASGFQIGGIPTGTAKANEAKTGGSNSAVEKKSVQGLHMELDDFIEKLSDAEIEKEQEKMVFSMDEKAPEEKTAEKTVDVLAKMSMSDTETAEDNGAEKAKAETDNVESVENFEANEKSNEDNKSVDDKKSVADEKSDAENKPVDDKKAVADEKSDAENKSVDDKKSVADEKSDAENKSVDDKKSVADEKSNEDNKSVDDKKSDVDEESGEDEKDNSVPAAEKSGKMSKKAKKAAAKKAAQEKSAAKAAASDAEKEDSAATEAENDASTADDDGKAENESTTAQPIKDGAQKTENKDTASETAADSEDDDDLHDEEYERLYQKYYSKRTVGEVLWKDRKKRTRVFFIVLLILAVLVVGMYFFVAQKLNMIDYSHDDSTTPSTTMYPEEIIYAEEDFAMMSAIENANSLKDYLYQWSYTGEGQEDELMSSKNVINVLVLGLDSDNALENGGRSDTNIIISLNRKTKRINLTSIYRDSWVYMNVDGTDRYTKLNAAYFYGGPQGIVDTIERNLKIDIDYYAAVDYTSFVDIIQALGGITVEVQEYEAEYIRRTTVHKEFEYGPAVTLDGYEALVFARIRKSDSDSDISRTRRQRQVIVALLTEMRTASLQEINAAINALFKYVKTDISKSQLVSYATQAVFYDWINYQITETVLSDSDVLRTGYIGEASAVFMDFPLAANRVQSEVYGTSNIILSEGRETIFDYMD